MYALNLSEDKRILSACELLPIKYDEEDNPIYDIVDNKYHGMLIVKNLPDGDIADYKCIDGKYVYDPLPEEPEIEPEPTTDEVLNVLLGIGGEA